MSQKYLKNLKIACSGREDGPMNFTGHPEFDVPRARNRERFLLKSGFTPDQQVFAKLVHGPTASVVWQPNSVFGTPTCDGLITKKHNLVLTMNFADCPPVVLYDASGGGTVAVFHSGWKPLAGGIIPNSIKKMAEELGVTTEFMEAYVGPGICKDHYEIGPDVAWRFGIKTDTKVQFSLQNEITKQLRACGVKKENIDVSTECVFDSIASLIPGIDIIEPYYYSYRRDKRSAPLDTNMIAVQLM